ncbi:hypothetical protein CASFOL_030995 [Castilleja foliolosa]|uniref:Membrane protein insertion efficiency factor YidD n=1 Tax=Castilleja foliolosa TaxID=1961234 RepID=A0ABD3C8V6_9LAMI
MKLTRSPKGDVLFYQKTAVFQSIKLAIFSIKALLMLKFYKSEISPLLPKSCRYVPTCSGYSMNAYKKYGVAKGTISTAYRLCRCNIDCSLSLLLQYTTTIFKCAGDDAVGLEQQEEDADGITLLKVRRSARFMSFNVWSQGRYF